MAEQDGFGDFADSVGRADERLAALGDGRAVEAAKAIEDAFANAGRSIETSLSAAARSGELAFSSMVQSVLGSLSKLAIDRFVEGPLAKLIEAVPFLGQRADGGVVTPGRAFIVGERGPELFVPASAGAIEPQPPSGVAVHFHIGPGADAASLQRSSAQLASVVARAVARGQRRL